MSTEIIEVSELDHVPPLSVCVNCDELSKQISEVPSIAGPICKIFLELPLISIELILKSFPFVLESTMTDMSVLSDDPTP